MKPLLDFELLNTFATVVAEGGFKGAASKLFRSQAAISMQIKRLEELLETSLLQRNNRGIKLTQSGETLLAYTDKLLSLNNETLNALSKTPLRGEVHFGVPTDYAPYFLRHFIPQLRLTFPELVPLVTCARSRELRKMVARAEVDIAIVTGEPTLKDSETLWSERLLWLGTKHLEVEPNTALPVALYDGDCILRDICLNDLKKREINFKPVVKSAEIINLEVAVASGLAVSLLPESCLHTNPELRELPGWPESHVLYANLIQASTLEPKLLSLLADCMRESMRKGSANA
ncbi:LysR family transcriptional regulator [Neptunomonas sp. XY-337]|uniref:LysR family transcriptional regulator n=1 Tax=Neptunomonas sp. XY-337 TaxID=2561897 RepID=UPI00145B5245|nr:LysR family transcriptional regulator [Neptunomonas sp. XY-337]